MLNVALNVRAEALTYLRNNSQNLRNNGQNKRNGSLGMAEVFSILDEV
jgi:hypothetical protein